MAKRIVTRGNTVFFTFTFHDEDEAVATSVDSAGVQLTFPGVNGFETALVALTESGNTWIGEWDSSVASKGWCEYHAHAIAGDYEYAQDGRFRLTGNRASFDHDELPTSNTRSNDYGPAGSATDYPS